MLLVAIKNLQGHYLVQSNCSAMQSICVGKSSGSSHFFFFLNNVTAVLSVLCTKNISVVRFRFQPITGKKT